MLRAVIAAGLLAIASDVSAQTPEEIRLWPGKAPGSEKWTVPEVTTSSPAGDRTISNVSDPTVAVFLPPPASATGTAVVVAPGGALRVLGWDNEGTKVAQWLNSKGIAALVLKYRTLQTMPGGGRGRGAAPPGGAAAGPRKELEIRNGNANPEPDDPGLREVLQMGIADAQQALRLARRNAAAWRIDPARIGIMGFSAGGHLAATASTHFNDVIINNKENSNLRPDFSILVYPVISFSDSLAHKGSRKNLLGDSASIDQLQRFSNEKQVTPKTPPTFLIHCGDDKVVPIGNSISYYESLLRNGVKAELHIYPTGGHGFALNNTTITDKWLDRCFNWMISNQWL